jgi:hypothetical protein
MKSNFWESLHLQCLLSLQLAKGWLRKVGIVGKVGVGTTETEKRVSYEMLDGRRPIS